MPFDTAELTPIRSRSVEVAPRVKARCLTLGVFNHDGAWKVYSRFEPACAYPNRAKALAAAERRAQEAVHAGIPVEFFVQEEDGSLGQAQVLAR